MLLKAALRRLSPLLAGVLAGLLIAPLALAQDFKAKPLPGPVPTLSDIAYAKSDATTGMGHLVDLYLPADRAKPVPVVIFTHGSGWLADNGRFDAQAAAQVLNPLGYAVAGVAVRSSAQAQYPAQLHDIKAAIRWLRAHAAEHGLDAAHIGIMGESSGGWTSAMAAVTGDEPDLEGAEGVSGYSSAVQAAVAFYPPTDFLQMDPWGLRPCDPLKPGWTQGQLCHRSADSPESRLLGCTLESCPEKAKSANPIGYISRADPPIMIIHGENDALVPHAQGEALYQALNKACHDAVFLSLPISGHGVWNRMLTDQALGYGATIRSTSAQDCAVMTPSPVTPSWKLVADFLDRALKPKG